MNYHFALKTSLLHSVGVFFLTLSCAKAQLFDPIHDKSLYTFVDWATAFDIDGKRLGDPTANSDFQVFGLDPNVYGTHSNGDQFRLEVSWSGDFRSGTSDLDPGRVSYSSSNTRAIENDANRFGGLPLSLGQEITNTVGIRIISGLADYYIIGQNTIQGPNLADPANSNNGLVESGVLNFKVSAQSQWDAAETLNTGPMAKFTENFLSDTLEYTGMGLAGVMPAGFDVYVDGSTGFQYDSKRTMLQDSLAYPDATRLSDSFQFGIKGHVTPEPSSISLFGIATIFLLARRKRQVC